MAARIKTTQSTIAILEGNSLGNVVVRFEDSFINVKVGSCDLPVIVVLGLKEVLVVVVMGFKVLSFK